MTETQLVETFEAERRRLRGVAYRMLGSLAEAEDVVQESWFRLQRSDASAIDNVHAWLTTVVARLCLDALRTRRARREDLVGFTMPETIVAPEGAQDPEAQAQLADSVGLAMLVVLDQLTPPERLAFVLHDVFGVSFDEIAPIVNRSPEAARQLASRARRRVRGADADGVATRIDQRLQRRVVNAFLAAGRNGDFDALVRTLDPDVVVHVDFGRARTAAASEVRGADDAARSALLFRAQAPGARAALVNGSPGLVVFSGSRPYAILGFEFRGDLISEIYVLADPDRLARIDFTVLDG